ncbi:MAG: hypothetical protein JO316_22635 [Abitibacteriaceae bacterium]|nr:hypothetical protein [Abditibacteriaceae bacterium]
MKLRYEILTLTMMLFGGLAHGQAVAAGGSIAKPGQDALPQINSLVVAADGSGQYKAVQEAINAAPTGSADKPTVIHIKPGTYREQLYVQREKRFLRFVGEDAARTVLTYDLYANVPGPDGKPIGTFRTPSTYIDADDFTAENITFENAAGPKGQALAIRIDGDRIAFRHCRFLGWQDTILDNRGRHYYQQCDITGSVDFIFGGATAVYDRCNITEIRDVGGPQTAPSTPQDQPYGFIFLHCHLIKGPGVKTGSSTLMRPWRDYGQSVFINCVLDDHISAKGWSEWAGREKTCRAEEYGSKTPEGKAIDLTARALWARQLTAEAAAQYTLSNIFKDWNAAQALAAKNQ